MSDPVNFYVSVSGESKDQRRAESFGTVKAKLQMAFSKADSEYVELSAPDIISRNNHIVYSERNGLADKKCGC